MNANTPHKKASPRTIDDFIAELEAKNQTQADWARLNNFALGEVYAVTRGRSAGRRGKARDILIAMGVTPPPMFGPRTEPPMARSGLGARSTKPA